MKIVTLPFDFSAETNARPPSCWRLLLEELLNLRRGLREGHHASVAALGDLDDVVAELSLDQVADLAGLQREGGLVELRRRLAARDEPEVAAALRARVLRVLPGQRREVLA